MTLDGSPGSGHDDDGPAGARDAVLDIEAVWGGAGPDRLVGNASDNLLNGGPGADVLLGGAGEDVADYSERTDGVDVTPNGAPASGNAEDGPTGARDEVDPDAIRLTLRPSETVRRRLLKLRRVHFTVAVRVTRTGSETQTTKKSFTVRRTSPARDASRDNGVRSRRRPPVRCMPGPDSSAG